MPLCKEGHDDAVIVSSCVGPAMISLCKEGHCDAVIVSSCVCPAVMPW